MAKNLITPRRAGIAGILGTTLFAAALVFLTIVEYEFMLSIGWKPLSDPGGAWPSGLALGPYGWMINAGFIISGSLLMVFSIGLHRGIKEGSRIGPAFLFVSGAAMASMAFSTDPILREGPRSLHGWIHDISFIVFALSMLVSLFFLWRRFEKEPLWRAHARYTLATGLVAVICLFLPGLAYYFFIVVLLAWIFVTAMKLWRGDLPSASFIQ